MPASRPFLARKSQVGDRNVDSRTKNLKVFLAVGAARMKIEKRRSALGTPPQIERLYYATALSFAFALLLSLLAVNSAATAPCSFSTSTR